MLKGLALAASWLVLAAQSPVAPSDDTDLIASVLDFADMLPEDPAGGDQLLAFGREAGQVVAIGMAVLDRGESWPKPTPETIAIMRSRSGGRSERKGPKQADFDFVRANGVTIFIIGLWSNPLTIWEVARIDGQVRWRRVGTDAHAGPWQMPARAKGAH